MNSGSLKKKAFTLVELMVSLAIFFIMTALLIAKYGTFNNSVLLTNLAYDMALTIRTAQTYGLSVQKHGDNTFQYPYGVAFCAKATCGTGASSMTNKEIVIFADKNSPDVNNAGIYGDGKFDSADLIVGRYAIKRGAFIVGMCSTENCSTPDDINDLYAVNVTFMRPNPDANICSSIYFYADSCWFKSVGGYQYRSAYMKIFIQAPDGNIRSIIIRKTGQISVDEEAIPTAAP